MFAGVTNIIAVNTELLKGLVQRIKNWSDNQKLGDLILNMVRCSCTMYLAAHLSNGHIGTMAENVYTVHFKLRARTQNFRRTQRRVSIEFL